jgi:hypothetical protein
LTVGTAVAIEHITGVAVLTPADFSSALSATIAGSGGTLTAEPEIVITATAVDANVSLSAGGVILTPGVAEATIITSAE